MPKPRTWKTGFKHLGTILANPLQYYRYRKYRDAFVSENHLDLHHAYHGERVGAGHPYPGAHGATVRERGVIYPNEGGHDDHQQTVVRERVADLQPFDHQQARGVDPTSLGHDRDTLLVLRREADGVPVLRAAKKRGPHTDERFPDIGRTQHSTLSGGEPVGAAALFMNGRVVVSSGHYQPDEEAAVKLAIHGKQTGTLLRRETDFHDLDGQGRVDNQRMDLSMKRRMQVVSNWAQRRG